MNPIDIASKLNLELNGIDNRQIEHYKDLYYDNKEATFEVIQKEGNWREIFLDLYVNIAVDTYKRYKNLDIDEEIFFDTMSVLPIWATKCQKKTGVNGIEEYEWISRFLDLKIFKLGRLQFEPIPIHEEIYVNHRQINKGTIAYNVHIQEGEKLSYEKVQDSYQKAITFFRGISDIFVCNSWLLNPNLKKILGADSNIARFQEDYETLYINDDSRQFEKRVFGGVQEEIENYPEDTTIQRKGKEYLKKGGKIGKTLGAFQFDGATGETVKSNENRYFFTS